MGAPSKNAPHPARSPGSAAPDPGRPLGLTGDSFTDGSYQSSWDNSRPQPVAPGGLTLYSGGAAGLLVGRGSEAEQVARHLPDVERTFAGSSAYLNGRSGRAFWPGEPFVKASYAAYQPGQYTTIAGAEIRPVGHLFFAGEHCSLETQGYMNGAAETGRVAGNAIGNLVQR